MSERFTLPRSGQAPLAFEGELIAECPGDEVAREPNRWHDLAVYKTAGGKYVVSIAYRSRWQGELGHDRAAVVETAEAVAAALTSYDPTEGVAGYPEGSAYAAKQARLMADVRARYEEQVSRVLASDEFAERVE